MTVFVKLTIRAFEREGAQLIPARSLLLDTDVIESFEDHREGGLVILMNGRKHYVVETVVDFLSAPRCNEHGRQFPL